MPVIWDASYEVDLGPHVFVTAKYRLAKDALLAAGTISVEQLRIPSAASHERLAAVHTRAYLDKIANDDFSFAERMLLEIPFTTEVRDAMALACGGTCDAVSLAMEHGGAVHLGGGFHHAFAGHGEGFCLLNDVAIAARAALDQGLVERVAVVDLDVHHGNGTAAIFADEPAVYTLSVHQENNYPAEKPPSDLDVGLSDGVGDDGYLEVVERSLATLFQAFEPDAVLYLAGADPYRDDQLGGLRLTLDGLRRRDRTVFRESAARDVPVATVLAGGYAWRLEDTVAIHVATVEEAMRRPVVDPR